MHRRLCRGCLRDGRRRQFIGIFAEALAWAFDQCLYEFVVQVAVAYGYCACLAEQRRIAVALEAEEAMDGAEVELLGLSSRKDGLYNGLEVRTDSFGPGYEVFGAVGSIFPRVWRKVLLDVCIVIAAVGTHVGGDTFARVVYAYLCGGEGDLDPLPDPQARPWLRLAPPENGTRGYAKARRCGGRPC